MKAEALDGLTVVDVGGTVATAYCGRLFAAHGARVIDVEPVDGNALRRQACGPASAGVLHAWLSAGKESAVLEVDLARDACRRADVVLWSEGDVTLPDAGVGMRISWFGTGPDEQREGSNWMCHARIGRVRMIGPVEGPPRLPGGVQAEIVGATAAFNGALGAVIGRELGNVDGPLDLETSIVEANTCFTDVAVIGAYNEVPSPPRLGINRFPPTFPLGVYPTADGWIGVTVLTPPQWHAFCELLELPELAHLPDYQSSMSRLMDADVLEMQFAPRLLEWSSAELFHRAQAMRIPLTLTPDMDEIFALDQFNGRNALPVCGEFDGRPLRGPGIPFRLLQTPARSLQGAAAPGAHTAAVRAWMEQSDV